MKHTQGPWRIGRYMAADGNCEGPIRVWDANGNVVADVPHTDQGWEDAQLIAAAPELLDALEALAADVAAAAESETHEGRAVYLRNAASEARELLARIEGGKS